MRKSILAFRKLLLDNLNTLQSQATNAQDSEAKASKDLIALRDESLLLQNKQIDAEKTLEETKTVARKAVENATFATNTLEDTKAMLAVKYATLAVAAKTDAEKKLEDTKAMLDAKYTTLTAAAKIDAEKQLEDTKAMLAAKYTTLAAVAKTDAEKQLEETRATLAVKYNNIATKVHATHTAEVKFVREALAESHATIAKFQPLSRKKQKTQPLPRKKQKTELSVAIASIYNTLSMNKNMSSAEYNKHVKSNVKRGYEQVKNKVSDGRHDKLLWDILYATTTANGDVLFRVRFMDWVNGIYIGELPDQERLSFLEDTDWGEFVSINKISVTLSLSLSFSLFLLSPFIFSFYLLLLSSLFISLRRTTWTWSSTFPDTFLARKTSSSKSPPAGGNYMLCLK
jgi:hypothetical protein